VFITGATGVADKTKVLALRFRPAEKNRPVKKVLLEEEEQQQTAVRKSTREEENVPLAQTCGD
jgi:hypothetical protein